MPLPRTGRSAVQHQWLDSLLTAATDATAIEQPIFAVEGTTLRRSHVKKNGQGALHSVSI